MVRSLSSNSEGGGSDQYLLVDMALGMFLIFRCIINNAVVYCLAQLSL